MSDDRLRSPEVTNWLIPLETVGLRRRSSVRRVGGKAATLAQLSREGFPVPRGWVIDARRFARDIESTLPRGHDLSTLIKLAHTQAGVDRAARARDHILEQDLPAELTRALEALWEVMEPAAPWGFAIRSSATCEDTDQTSLAGLASTVLGVRGPSMLADAVRTVWASAFLPRALAYLAHEGVREIGMAVLLQVMVRADAAGVIFTAPPPGLSGDHWHPDERLVNATLGLGAPVVEGAAVADMVRIQRGGGVVFTAIADKRRALVVGSAGVSEVAVDEARARAPALSDEALKLLIGHVDRLEEKANLLFHAGNSTPLDVEFAVDAGDAGSSDARPRVWIVQARPITGDGFPEGGDAETVWSRANVGEALPGPATPLTWSIARAFSDKGFHQAFASLGCTVPRGAHLVSDVHGRFYLNLTAFMQIAAQVPGLSPRSLLEASGGASDGVISILEQQVAGVSHRRFMARLPVSIPAQLARYAKLESEVTAFETTIERARHDLLDLDLSLLPDDGIATTLRGARALLDRTGTLMLACASAALAGHLALCAMLNRVDRRHRPVPSGSTPDDLRDAREDSTGTVAQALVGAVCDLDSASPGLALAKVASVLHGDRVARDRLLSGSVHHPKDLPEGPGRSAVEAFLGAYGDRAVREAEIATPRWSEDPAQVIAMLTSALRVPPGETDRALARARSIADREMARLETRTSRIEAAVIRAIIKRAQHYARLRERMRTWVTRVLGMIRTVALDIDRRLRRIDPSLSPGSVFFCTYGELMTALRSGRADVGHLVRLRLAEHARDSARPDPPPTFIGRPPPVLLPPSPHGRLTGLPASAGVVEGSARVLAPGASGLDAVAPGEILVSRTTDVGLSPLFLVAAAVVTELGGPLSHAAIVAREYGIPAVVNVTGATLAIRTGDRLRVDGDRGFIELLGQP